MTTILGVDCATQPRKTGLALADVREGVVCVTRCAVGSSGRPPAVIAVEWLKDCDDVLLAFDSPLGWPRALGDCLHGHRAGEVLHANADSLFRRAADTEIHRRLGKLPLEVGANFLARTAAAALVLLDEIRRETGRKIPMAWFPVEKEPWRVIEVYPAATRIAHGAFNQSGSIEGLSGVLDCSTVLAGVQSSLDAADACVCALAGADFLAGRAVPPGDLETALVEGWIWAPERLGPSRVIEAGLRPPRIERSETDAAAARSEAARKANATHKAQREAAAAAEDRADPGVTP